MNRPKILDLCCGVGGTSRGLDLAGFDVFGVDVAPQPDYPYPIHQGDALEVLRRLLNGRAVTFSSWYGRPGHFAAPALEHLALSDFAALAAGWPCQAANPLTTGTNAALRAAGKAAPAEHPQLIPAGRELMVATGLPWVIENTAGAPIRRDLMLCGETFGLAVTRHRYFEVSGFDVPQSAHPRHRGRTRGYRHGVWHDGPYLAVYGSGGGKATVDEARTALGIDWTRNLRSLAESIPPAYSRYVGEHLLAAVTAERVA